METDQTSVAIYITIPQLIAGGYVYGVSDVLKSEAYLTLDDCIKEAGWEKDINDKILHSIPKSNLFSARGSTMGVEFISFEKEAHPDEIEDLLAKKDFALLNPTVFYLLNKAYNVNKGRHRFIGIRNEEFLPLSATQWKDKEGRYCSISFTVEDGKKKVSVRESLGAYPQDMYFPCIVRRKFIDHPIEVLENRIPLHQVFYKLPPYLESEGKRQP